MRTSFDKKKQVKGTGLPFFQFKKKSNCFQLELQLRQGYIKIIFVAKKISDVNHQRRFLHSKTPNLKHRIQQKNRLTN